MMMALSGSSTPPPPTDPFWADVSCLLHFDGVDTGTVFTDQKGLTFTGAGGAITSTTTPEFGTAALQTSANGDIVTTPDDASLQMGVGDFTIEFSIYYADVTNFITPLSKGYVVGNAFLFQAEAGTGKMTFYHGAATVVVQETVAPALNTWIRYCVERDAGVTTLYKNGAVVDSAADVLDYNSNAAMSVGNDLFGASAHSLAGGFMDELRITKGVARYGGAYTPATAAFPNS